MEYSPSRLAETNRVDNLRVISKMSTLAMPAPYPHTGFHREFAWQQEARPTESLHRQRIDAERVALPSIRQAFPELQLRIQQDGTPGTPSSTTSPTVPLAGTLTPPEYVHSPNQNKRRRLSFEDDREGERASQVPRLYASPGRVVSRYQSPPVTTKPVPEPWGASSKSSPYMANGSLPIIRSPVTMEVRERIEAPRPTLPSLPHLNFERNGVAMARVRSHSGDDYVTGLNMMHSNGPVMEAAAPYRQASYTFGYHHPSRIQSLSLGSIHPFDRTPFSAAAAYGHPYQDAFMRIGELGMGIGGDSKQRKRRGNLPKETTDKLRAWFVAHLHHPYPSEDEKQDLMRQTGLQMNQISNWFINARRRQLPTMISNARAETDAMSGRGGDSKVLPSTERIDYDNDGKRASVPLSDGDGSAFDDVDMDTLNRQRTSHIKRGSI